MACEALNEPVVIDNTMIATREMSVTKKIIHLIAIYRTMHEVSLEYDRRDSKDSAPSPQWNKFLSLPPASGP